MKENFWKIAVWNLVIAILVTVSVLTFGSSPVFLLVVILAFLASIMLPWWVDKSPGKTDEFDSILSLVILFVFLVVFSIAIAWGWLLPVF